MQTALWMLLLLAAACVCKPLEIIDPCKLTAEEIKEAELSLETLVGGVEKPYSLRELAYSGRSHKDTAVCKCKHGVQLDEENRRWVKTYEWCSDDRWKVLAEIAIALQKQE